MYLNKHGYHFSRSIISKRLAAHLLCCFFLLVMTASFAQTFVPDKDGYIKDPAFGKLMKAKGYKIVTAFSTVNNPQGKMLASALKDGKFVLVDTKGNLASRYEPFEINSSAHFGDDIAIPGGYFKEDESYIQVNINGKYGTVKKGSEVVGLPASFDALTYISDGLMRIELGKKKGLARANGTILHNPYYDEIRLMYNDGIRNLSPLFTAVINGKVGLLSTKGQLLLPAEYDDINYCKRCDISQRLLIITKQGKNGLATTAGKVLLQPVFKDIFSLSSNGPIAMSMESTKGRLYGIIDSTGKTLLEANYPNLPEYLPKEKLLKLNSGSRDQPLFGFSSLSGKILVEAKYQRLEPFKGGLALAEMDGKYGALARNGSVVLPFRYQQINILTELSYIIASEKDSYQLFNANGQSVFKNSYEHIIPVNAQTFVISDGGKWKKINSSGVVLYTFPYENIRRAQKLLIAVQNGKTGVVDLNGKIVFPFKYDKILGPVQDLKEGFIYAEINKERYLADRYGNEVPAREAGL